MLTVPSEDQLNEYLTRIEGFVLECTRHTGDVPTPRTTQASPPGQSRVGAKHQELVSFSWYLHTLIEAGVPLLKSLQIVSRQMPSESWQAVIAALVEDLRRGESFGDAIKRFPRCFPKPYVHMIEVGELSGQLDEVLSQLARYGEKQLETRSRIKAALAYPSFLVISCAGVTVFLMTFVLPKVAKMFTRAKLELPAVTQLAMNLSNFMRENAITLLVGVVGTVIGAILWRNHPSGKRAWSTVALHMPCVGGLYRKYVLASYCRTLSLLNRTGVSLLVSLAVARNGVSNSVLSEFLERVEDSLQEGAALGEERARSPYIPEMVSSMISVGEETGRLSDMLQNVTRFYERDIDQTIQLLPKIVEPIVIVVMTGVVALIATSVFLPLSKLTAGVG